MPMLVPLQRQAQWSHSSSEGAWKSQKNKGQIMHSNQQNKYHVNTGSFTSAGTATASIVDCKGFDAATINVFSSITNNWSTLAIQQSDTTDSTNFASISGTVLSTDYATAAYVTASGTTQASGVVFNVSTKGRKRYLRVLHGGASQATSTIVVALGHAANAPYDATTYGAITVVNA